MIDGPDIIGSASVFSVKIFNSFNPSSAFVFDTSNASICSLGSTLLVKFFVDRSYFYSLKNIKIIGNCTVLYKTMLSWIEVNHTFKPVNVREIVMKR